MPCGYGCTAEIPSEAVALAARLADFLEVPAAGDMDAWREVSSFIIFSFCSCLSA